MKINVENILADFQLFFNSIPNISESKLFSFAFHIQKPSEIVQINSLNKIYDDILLFRTAKTNNLIIGLNSVLEIQPKNTIKFADVNQNFTYWKQNFINNWNKKNDLAASIIFCSAKFDPQNSSQLWDQFHPLRVYVPEIILTYQNENHVGYFNFLVENNNKLEYYSEKLINHLEKLSEIDSDSKDTPSFKIAVEPEKNDSDNWFAICNDALKHLENGDVSKLVLSRKYNLNIYGELNWDLLLQQLNQRFPDCYLFFIKRDKSIFFGSSPEMFLKVSNGIVEVESMAGSAARSKKSETDSEFEKFLSTSEKNHWEHLFVTNFITDVLVNFSKNVRVIEEKQIRKLDNIQHLITKISSELNSTENLFELIDSLFPTPAVCGVPKEKALRLIRKLETHDRGFYSGLVGLFDFENNCELAVSIRSALVKKNRVTAFAGAGLVIKSDPQEEYLETNLKLNTILSLFGDEN